MADFILGISDDYMGNVTLLHKGRPVFAAANERYVRKKGDAGFPDQALQAALDFAGITLADVDRVVVANKTHFVYRLLKSRFEDYEHDFFDIKQKAYLKYHDLVRASRPVAGAVHLLNRSLVAARLGRPALLVDHHLAHALSSIYSAPFDDCLAVSVDNLGDGHSTKIHSFRNGRVEMLYGSNASVSPGQFYGEITQLLGFNPLRHAGKVTGLAAHGDPRAAYGLMEKLFWLSADKQDFGMMPSALRWQHRGPYWQLSLFSREDVAAAAQKRLEDVVVEYVRHALRKTGHTHIALSGGVFANVKLNLALLEMPEVKGIHVHPAMSDEGLATGAAAYGLLQNGSFGSRRLDTVFLGSGYDQTRMNGAATAGRLTAVRPDTLAHTAARLLAAGHSVVRYDGRFEYGPRALGNRSILYRADDVAVNDWLNERLKRTEFMPFAPVTLWEDAGKVYQGVDGGKDCARYMTMAFHCAPSLKQQCPGIVHVDGTARPQLIRREDNPGYYDILKHYKELTGLPCLINTSFNMHEEPIVNTPEDAVRTFQKARLDFLILGDRIAMDPCRSDLQEVWNDVCTGNQ
jgi:carbamoyltransferase